MTSLMWPWTSLIFMTRMHSRARLSSTKISCSKYLSIKSLRQRTLSSRCTIRWMTARSAFCASTYPKTRWTFCLRSNTLLQGSCSTSLHARSEQVQWKYYQLRGLRRIWRRKWRLCETWPTKTKRWWFHHLPMPSIQTTSLSFSTQSTLSLSVPQAQQLATSSPSLSSVAIESRMSTKLLFMIRKPRSNQMWTFPCLQRRLCEPMVAELVSTRSASDMSLRSSARHMSKDWCKCLHTQQSRWRRASHRLHRWLNMSPLLRCKLMTTS